MIREEVRKVSSGYLMLVLLTVLQLGFAYGTFSRDRRLVGPADHRRDPGLDNRAYPVGRAVHGSPE